MGNLSNIIETIRQQLINMETARTELRNIKTENPTEAALKLKLQEYADTLTADLLIYYDVLDQAETCISDSDLELLFELLDANGTVN